MSNLLELERKKLQSIANEYRSNGYEVFLEFEDAPTFLRGSQADLVAMSPSDNVVLEVVSKNSIGNSEKLERLAKLVAGRKNWRFEVVVTNPKSEQRSEISLQQIMDRIHQTKNLHSQFQDEAAILLGWSAAEAIMRVTAEEDGMSSKARTPIQLTKTLYSIGSIGLSDYNSLIAAAKMRNRIAHGYQVSEDDAVLHRVVERLLRSTASMFSELTDEISSERDQMSVEELVAWFYEHYDDPANGVPYESAEGGYQYIFGGPYDPWEVLADKFHWVDDGVIEKAANEIYSNGHEWIEKGQY